MVESRGDRNFASPSHRNVRRRQRTPSPLSTFLPSAVLSANPPAPSAVHEAHVPVPVDPPPAEIRRVMLKRSITDNSAVISNSVHSRLGQAPSNANKEPRLGSMVTKPRPESTFDRNRECPILVRIFFSTNGQHTPLALFSNGKLPHPEIQVNTWLNASLRELARDLRDACPLARRKGARLQFATVFPDSQREGVYRRRILGTLITGQPLNQLDANARNGQIFDEAFVTLESKQFQIGDYLDIAISEPPREARGQIFDQRRIRTNSKSNDRFHSDKEAL